MSGLDARRWPAGLLVMVARPLGVTERGLVGRVVTFDGMTETHGYARCRMPDTAQVVLLHPEALDPVVVP